jgi:hypothetical protein
MSTVTRSPAIDTASRTQQKTGQSVAAFFEVLLLGSWLGSMIFFSFAVAPSAFAVLPTRELAGAMVTSTIGKIEMLGLILGPVLMVFQLARWMSKESKPAIAVLRIVLIAVMIASAGLSRFWISPAMVSLRAAMGGHIDDVPVGDPIRIQFNHLHQYSVGLMGAAMLAGILLLFLTVRSWNKR